MLFRWFSLKEIHITKPILIKDLVFVIRQPQMKTRVLSCGIIHTEPDWFSHKRARLFFFFFQIRKQFVSNNMGDATENYLLQSMKLATVLAPPTDAIC